MERELAHVEKIVDIQPIPGADRVELATVLGWKVMVRKGQFKVGDLAVYIEIDSECPHEEPFTFLEKNHYKIKTQKYFKGTVLSQGLLMSLDDLNIPADSVREGDGLTEKLHIRYSTPEDNYRKRPSADKYKQMARRNPKLFKKPWAQWMMKRPWGKKVMFALFGKKSDKKRGWPEWVVKTDETRCLAGRTKIETNEGIKSISSIVNQKLPVLVKSVNSNGEIEYKPIVSYQKYLSDDDLLDIEFIQQKIGDTKHNRIVCTQDHKLHVNGEYKEARYIKEGDILSRLDVGLGPEVLPVLYGILLGDGGIWIDERNSNSRIKFSFTQSVQHYEYFLLVKKVFGDKKESDVISGYTGKQTIKSFNFTDSLCSSMLYKFGSIQNNKFHITKEFCNALTPLSLAVWYLDDGCIRHRDFDIASPTGELATNNFSKEENELLLSTLQNRFGIDSSLKYDRTRGLYSIYISVDGMVTLSNLIARYVPDCMKYKLPDVVCSMYSFDEKLWPVGKNIERIVETPVYSVKKFINKSNGYHVGNVYDIEVADNHNFFANGILSHNCQNIPWILDKKGPWVTSEKLDGCSASYTLKRGLGLFGKDEFYVCSRNVVQETPDQDNWYDTNVYWEIEKIYNMRAVLSVLMDILDVDWITIQGEIYGHKIQKRDYGMKDIDFAAFNLITSENGRYGTEEMEEILRDRCGIPCVPIVDSNYMLPDTIDEILEYAGSESSQIDGGMREGVVFRSKDGSDSFKAVSNEYLLKYD